MEVSVDLSELFDPDAYISAFVGCIARPAYLVIIQ